MHALSRTLGAALAGAALLAPPRQAEAHPPLRARGVVWGAGAALVVRTNRGLVFASGGALRLLCPMAIGAFPTEQLPLVASKQGGWLVGTSSGVVHLDERGCRDSGPARLARRGVQDLVESSGGAPLVYVVTADATAGSAVFRSTDSGSSFELVHALAEREFFNSVVVDALGSALYLAGERLDETNQVRHFIAAGAAGADLELQPLELEPEEARLRVLAVDPANPEVVVAGAFASTQSSLPHRLLRSEDSGRNWRTWHVISGLQQLSFSPDGQTAWLSSEAGLLRSDAGGAFSSVPLERPPSCAIPSGDQLIVCDALGVHDSRDGARSFEPLLRFVDVTAPVSCDGSGYAAPECRSDWEEFSTELARVFGDGAAAADPGSAAGSMSGRTARAALDVAAGASGDEADREPSMGCSIPSLRSGHARSGPPAGRAAAVLGALLTLVLALGAPFARGR